MSATHSVVWSAGWKCSGSSLAGCATWVRCSTSLCLFPHLQEAACTSCHLLGSGPRELMHLHWAGRGCGGSISGASDWGSLEQLHFQTCVYAGSQVADEDRQRRREESGELPDPEVGTVFLDLPSGSAHSHCGVGPLALALSLCVPGRGGGLAHNRSWLGGAGPSGGGGGKGECVACVSQRVTSPLWLQHAAL